MEGLIKKYGSRDPQSIKLRIIWMTLKQVLLQYFGDSPTNRKILKSFDDDWKKVERHERAA